MKKDDLRFAKTYQERMNAEHVFRFNCSPGIECFTQCCRDVTIVLTPYDVLRLKIALQISSDEFLDRYSLIIPREHRVIPMVTLRMNEHDRRCPFVNGQGCQVYAERPWPCRMFPLDMNDDGTFRIIADPSKCLGLQKGNESRITDWLTEQGTPIYDQMNAAFSEITYPLQAQELDIDNPKVHKMTFMALYNLDKFREFVFNSTFLDRFNIDQERIQTVKDSDLELLKLAFDWVNFGILGKKVFQVRQESTHKTV